MNMKINNGGSNAIKGFNYQSGVAIYMMIKHYHNDSFKICVEAQDDIDIMIDNCCIFMQIKSYKQSKTTLTNLVKKAPNSSILHKLWDKEELPNIQYRYKIVCTDFSGCNGIFEDGIAFNNCLYPLSNLDIDYPEYNYKLSNTYIAITPFKDNMIDTEIYLKGTMVSSGIRVDNGFGDIIFNELFKIIQLKSSIKSVDKSSINRKTISSQELKKLFNKGNQYINIIDECKKVLSKITANLNDDQLCSQIEKNIEKRFDILLRAQRNIITKIIGNYELESNYFDLIQRLFFKTKNNNIGLDDHEIYTVIIALVSEKIQEL